MEEIFDVKSDPSENDGSDIPGVVADDYEYKPAPGEAAFSPFTVQYITDTPEPERG